MRANSETIDADLAARSDVIIQAQHWAIVHTLCDDPGSAEAVLRASIENLDPGSELLAINRDLMAHTIIAQGRFDEADELSHLSEHAANLPSEAFGADWRRVRARVLAHRGRHDEAMALAHEASALMATTDYLNDRAATELDLAVVLRAARQHEDGGRAARHAIQIWELKENTVSAGLARQAFGLE